MTGSEEQMRLVTKILKGEIRTPEVEKELDRISKQYGDDCFNSYEVHKKAKPWNKDYLDELELLGTSGASSKEYYLHLAEVSDYLRDRSRSNGNKVLFVVIGIVVIALVAVTIWNINK